MERSQDLSPLGYMLNLVEKQKAGVLAGELLECGKEFIQILC